jgi:hypothetical protein
MGPALKSDITVGMYPSMIVPMHGHMAILALMESLINWHRSGTVL